jgi:hypothetical protein
MASPSGCSYFELEFGKNGSLVNADQVQQIITFLKSDATAGVSDVLVFSHGWNNDEDEARDLYKRFQETLQAAVDSAAVPGTRNHAFTFVGVLWPSKKFADAALIPGGAAGISEDNASVAIARQHEQLVDTLDSDAAKRVMQKAASLVKQLNSVAARQEWIDCLRQAVKTIDDPEPDGSNFFLDVTAEELFERLNNPALPLPPTPGEGGSGAGFGGIGGGRAGASGAGSAAGFGGLLSGIKGAALRILNYTTYYMMKNRAGVVGRVGLNPALQQIQSAVPTGILFHLLGHSFGARLVTAATNGPGAVRVQTLVLLQAAYSHYGMATNYDKKGSNGFFRDVVAQSKVAGPILISHSINDIPVGIAYAIASRLAGQKGAALGGPTDPYGGMGRNGAQETVGSQFLDLQHVAPNTPFKSHVANNLNGDNVIQGHSDICKPEIAHAFLHAIARAEVRSGM